MFNRVGNLTVLSLRKEINQIIDDKLNPDQLCDFATMRVYWKFYSDALLNIEDPSACDPCTMMKTYFLYSNNQVKEFLKGDL